MISAPIPSEVCLGIICLLSISISNAQGDSIEYYLRGGPSPDANPQGLADIVPEIIGGGSGMVIGNPMAATGDSPWGNVVGWQGIFEDGTPDYGRPNTVSIPIKESTQAILEPVFLRMTELLHEIADAEYRYNPINSNSNTVAFSILDSPP